VVGANYSVHVFHLTSAIFFLSVVSGTLVSVCVVCGGTVVVVRWSYDRLTGSNYIVVY
jgi:hypothetical protein